MKGDFTRLTFDRSKHYSSVLNQQGRVAIDADWNEQAAIEHHDARTTRQDVIGLCGGPQGVDADGNPLAGFDVTTDGAVLTVTGGRYYVDGILAEKEADTAITAQPDLPVSGLGQVAGLAAGAALPEGAYLAYLDVWERHITALEDESIREVALGGPDTATRTQVMAQVRLLRVGDAGVDFTCASPSAAWDALTAASTGQLEARAEPDDESESACVVPAKAGFRGLENQLYRVEVHRVISATRVLIKWSRENASVVVHWTGQDNLDANKLTVGSTGRDAVLGLAANNWAELTDDEREKRNEPGLLVKIVKVEGNVLTIDPGGQTINYADFGTNPKVRRWDMPADTGAVEVTVGAAAFTELELGVQIRLKAGLFRPGDYWLIPARTFNADIEWPRVPNTQTPIPQPPHGISHHYCRLALFDFVADVWTKRGDCRRLFPPLTEMIHFYGVGGDGQETLPGATLGQPLQVAVTNGEQPINNARVRFRLVPETAAGQLTGTSGSGKSVDVTTGTLGIYDCTWQLGAARQNQRVEAFLVEIDGKPFVDATGAPLLPSVFFNANLSVADRVAYDPANCPDLANARTVQQAIDALCARPTGGGCCPTVGEGGDYPDLATALADLRERGRQNICLCLLSVPGIYDIDGLNIDNDVVSLTIGSHGGARLIFSSPLRFFGQTSLTLHDLVLVPTPGLADEHGIAVQFDRCRQVTIERCQISGDAEQGTLIGVGPVDRLLLRDNVLEASQRSTMDGLLGILRIAEMPDELAVPFAKHQEGAVHLEQFLEAVPEAVRLLEGLDAAQRKELSTRLNQAVISGQAQTNLSMGELLRLLQLVRAIQLPQERPDAYTDLYVDLRRAAIKARPGTALVIMGDLPPEPQPDFFTLGLDEDDTILLESNALDGIVSLYGPPPPRDAIPQILANNILEQINSRLKEGQLAILGLMGTVHLHSNQITNLTVGEEMLRRFIDRAQGSGAIQTADLFGRLSLSNNVFEGGLNLMLADSVLLDGNQYSDFGAVLRGGQRILATAVVRPVPAADLLIADGSVLVGNQARQRTGGHAIRNIARSSQQAANLNIVIS
ncbi:MAG: hypothetical protein H3C34_11320 [Caldilineaceae bacterium]|nr:hypothetical protein [Caldilineaceae bacterium]